MEGLIENEADDSYILKEDKLNLIKIIKNIYNNKFQWADEVLLRVLIKKHYNNVINNINKDEYINELKNNDIDTLLNQI